MHIQIGPVWFGNKFSYILILLFEFKNSRIKSLIKPTFRVDILQFIQVNLSVFGLMLKVRAQPEYCIILIKYSVGYLNNNYVGKTFYRWNNE